MKLPIKNIHYSQDNIRDCFSDGSWLSELCEDFLSKKVTLESLARIPVAQKDGKWYAMDGNRRLFVLKKLHARGKLATDEIPVTQGFIGRQIKSRSDGNISIRGDASIATVIDNMISDFEKHGHSKQEKRQRALPSAIVAMANRWSDSDEYDSDCGYDDYDFDSYDYDGYDSDDYY